MPPTGEEFRQMLCKVLGEIRKNKEGDIVVPRPAGNEKKKDFLWFCDTIANGCFSKTWMVNSGKASKNRFSMAVRVSDIAFAIMVLEKHKAKWKNPPPGGKGKAVDRLMGVSLKESINYYQEVCDQLAEMFTEEIKDSTNQAADQVTSPLEMMDRWLKTEILDAKRKKEDEMHNLSFGATANERNKSKSGKKEEVDCVVDGKKVYRRNHGMQMNPHLQGVIDVDDDDDEERPVALGV